MKQFSAHRLAAAFASTAIIALATGTAHAQTTAASVAIDTTPRGTVTGRVYDETTGKSLSGAIVRVTGTNVQDVTTEDGRFQIAAPAGPVTLQVEYVGLDTRSYSVTISPRKAGCSARRCSTRRSAISATFRPTTS